MRAKMLVDLMLEAVPRGAVLAFGYGAPSAGFYGARLDDVINQFKTLGLVEPEMSALDAANHLIQQQNAAFVVQKNPGDIHVYSKATPLALDKEGKDRIATTFTMDTDNGAVAWSHSFGTSAQQKPSNEVFGTVKERKQRELDREHLSQREIMSQMTARSIPEGGVTPAQPAAGYQPRVKLGIDYDERSTNGIRIVKVNPNTPASRAGLSPEDILYTIGPYKSSLSPNGQPATYRLKTAQHFKTVLAQLDPDVPVPIKVLRGDGSLKLAIVPEKQ